MGSFGLLGFIEPSTLEDIFLIMLLVGFLFMAVSAFMSGAFESEFGEGSAFGDGDVGSMGGELGDGGAHGVAEVGWASHDLASFSPLSPTVISAFITAAGGMGYLSLHSLGMGVGGASAIALVSGIVFAAIVFLLVAWMFKHTQGSSVGSVASLVGAEAEVIETIPSDGFGRIAFVLAAQRMTMTARTADAAEVPQGATVVIKEVTQQFYVVEESRESWLAREKNRATGT
ncbi:MAG: NfeD family protein [Planctomycetota bacterium]|jgi:hypothetical protein